MKKRLFRLGALCCVAAMTITTGAQALSVEEAYDILQRSYVDKLPRAAQDAKSLDELFSYTDDYTYYMTAEEYQAFLQGVEGDVSFAGIGAEITYVPEGIRIVSVLKGGGAEKAGLAAGDYFSVFIPRKYGLYTQKCANPCRNAAYSSAFS